MASPDYIDAHDTADCAALRQHIAALEYHNTLLQLEIARLRTEAAHTRGAREPADMQALSSNAPSQQQEDRLHLFAALIEHTPDGIVATALDGTLMYANAAFYALLGCGNDLIGSHISQLCSNSSIALRMLQQTRAHGVWHGHLDFQHGDGRNMPAWVSSFYLYSEVEEPVAQVMVIRDSSEHRQLEEALHQSQRFLQSIADTTTDIIYVYDLVEDYYVYVNRQMLLNLGYVPREVRYRRDFVCQLVHPDDRERFAEYHARCSIMSDDMLLESEYRLQDTAGNWHWFHFYAGVLTRSDDGKTRQIIGTARDMSRRKQAEALQSMRLSVTRTLAEATSVESAIMRVLQTICRELDWQIGEMWQPDAESGVLRCTMLWYDPALAESEFVRITPTITFARGSGLPGRVWASERSIWVDQVATAPYFQRAAEAVQAGLHGSCAFPVGTGRDFNGVMCFFSRDARYFTGDLSAMMSDVGSHVGQFISCKQVEVLLEAERASLTERVAHRTAELSATNVELARAIRVKDNFLATMSHELRTPLNIILGLTESLCEHIYGPLNEKQLNALHLVDESGYQLLGLITDILDLSKIEAGKIDLQFDAVAVEVICESSLRFIKREALKKQITVDFVADHAQEIISSDARRLKQVLVNLLSNAVKFTPEGGRVGLEVTADADTISFSVWDTGIGIAPEDIIRLFSPFEQLDAGLNKQHQGVGLGLSLVLRLTELHGGSVAVVSQPGAGSRFTVTLPRYLCVLDDASRAHVALPADADLPPEPAAPQTSEQPLILLADDNDMTITQLQSYLLAGGYRVCIAHIGQKMLEHAREEHPALILIDMQMPGIDGLELLQQIRADDSLAQLPIIALTALVLPGGRERSLAAGANDYLSKPVDQRHLLQAVQRLLSLSG